MNKNRLKIIVLAVLASLLMLWLLERALTPERSLEGPPAPEVFHEPEFEKLPDPPSKFNDPEWEKSE